MIRFNTERTFGIEIEFLSHNDNGYINTAAVARAIREKGLNAQDEHYNHYTRDYWKVTTDSSCGYEVVSPILKGYEGLQELEKVLEALNSLNVKINKKCGVHIHHDVDDFSLEHFKNLFKMYIKYEKNIDKIMPPSRQGSRNEYCRSLTYNFNSSHYDDRSCYDKDEFIKKINDINQINDLEWIFQSRYVKLNFHSYVKYGTVEFRQHAGSTNYEKIYNWILLTQAMVEKSKISKVRNKMTAGTNEEKGILGLIGFLRINRKDSASDELRKVSSYYLKREKQLALNF